MSFENSSWKDLYNKIKTKRYFIDLMDFLSKEYSSKTIYPERKNLFNCFKACDLNKLKVVIIGQDPYHQPNQAHGLSFSVMDGVKFPPSLKNIFKEIANEYGSFDAKSGDLTYLAEQGVLLLNKYLTVEEGKPLSHKNAMYDQFFEDVISYIETINEPVVYLLWGGEAQKVSKWIVNPNHIYINSTHPSPLGANKGGWFNTGLFIKCNEFLISKNKNSIKWIKSDI